jgi:hypothetical protein
MILCLFACVWANNNCSALKGLTPRQQLTINQRSPDELTKSSADANADIVSGATIRATCCAANYVGSSLPVDFVPFSNNIRSRSHLRCIEKLPFDERI